MKKRNIIRDSKAQVWVETVIYTLIALVIIGTTLAFVRPKIQEMQDKAVVDRSLEMMQAINNEIISIIRGGAGNSRILELMISKGNLEINGKDDQINFRIPNSYYAASDPGIEVNYGSIIIYTEKKGKTYEVTLTLDYSTNYNIQYNGDEQTKTITQSSVPYKVSLSHQGKDLEAQIIIDSKIV